MCPCHQHRPLYMLPVPLTNQPAPQKVEMSGRSRSRGPFTWWLRNEDLQDRLDKLAADLSKQLQAVQKELTQQIDRQASDLQRKLLEFQSEARQRDDDLRVELLALGAMLDNQKTGRDELAQMLIQLGGQLQGNVKKTAVSAANSKKPKS